MLHRKDEVLTAAKSLDLVSLEIVKDELSEPQGNYLPDAQYLRFIAQVSADIHNEIDPRILPPQTYRNTFRWDFGWYRQQICGRPRYETELTLWQYPVLSISSITQDGAALAASDYDLDAVAGQIRRLSSGAYIPWRATEIIVDFVAGYSTIPADIVEAALELFTMRAKGRNRDPMLKSRDSEVLGHQEFWVGATPNMRGGMPARVAQIVDRYRPVIVA